MQILADENLPRAIIMTLRADGHNVVWARADLPRTKDSALLELAEVQGRILLTLDKDFWHIAVQRPRPLRRSGVVLLRVHPATTSSLEPLVRAFVSAAHEWAGHISIISNAGIQMVAAARK